MKPLIVQLEGLGYWSPGVADWSAFVAAVRESRALPIDSSGKPAATRLPATERRRAPEPVLLACEVGEQAAVMAGRDPATLPCVFASTHGDLVITDAMCETLATHPREISPVKFHNSVHNAAAGYWTVATQCHAPSSAMTAWYGTFAAGLFEAAVQVLADETPVLLAAYDIPSRGPLGSVVVTRAPFAAAFVLAPARTPATRASLTLRHVPADHAPTAPSAHAEALAAANPIANALPLLAALAAGTSADLVLRNGAHTALQVTVSP